MRVIHHSETVDGRRFTVVGTYHPEVNSSQVNFGIAICGPADCFARKTGVAIAEGRANKNPTITKKVTYEIPESKDGFKQLSEMGYEVVENVKEDPYMFQELLTEQYKKHKKTR